MRAGGQGAARVHRIIAVAIFAAIALAAVQPVLLRVLFSNREPLRLLMEERADASWYPFYPAFLEAVRNATKRGDRIAIVVPGMQWDNGYSYAYYRASYFLEGREVLPLVTRDDRPIPENLRKATHVAAWRARMPAPWKPVLTIHKGALLTR